MQYRFFVIPAKDSLAAAEELNKFLRSHRVLAIQREFVSESENSYWAVAVEFIGDQADALGSTGKSHVDYKEILSPDDFTVFARLRELRKHIADAEGMPPYIIFTNEQLAEFIRTKVKTKSAMGKIKGIGEAKLKKYADRFLEVLNETDQQPL